MEMTLQELIALVGMIFDAKIPENSNPKKTTVILGRQESGELTVTMTGEWKGQYGQ